jgi:hypothetical protein
MKRIILLTLLITSSSLFAAENCTLSRRNGGLVIEEQASRIIVEKMYFSSLMVALKRLHTITGSGDCLPPKARSCDITKRNGGFAIEDVGTRGLISNLRETDDYYLGKDLDSLIDFGICKKH